MLNKTLLRLFQKYCHLKYFIISVLTLKSILKTFSFVLREYIFAILLVRKTEMSNLIATASNVLTCHLIK